MTAVHLVCPHCAATNRVPQERLAEDPQCGQCGQPLAPAQPIELGDAQLAGFLAKTEVPVVIDFWAAWCGPCRNYAPHFQAVAERHPEWQMVKVDSDQAPVASQHFGVRSIPTTILWHQGREVARQAGAMSAAQLDQWVSQHLA